MVGTIGEIAIWAQLVATIYLVGLIWCIQVVHYPLMSHIEIREFVDFHRQHSVRVGSIVILPMVFELLASVTLAVLPPNDVAPTLPLLGLGLTVVIWISTFGIQVPLHRKLSDGFNADHHRLLVRSNWVRTLSWSLRAAIAVAMAVIAGTNELGP
jgi:hypothetical protein